MAKETLPEKQARLKESCVLFAESLYIYELIAKAVGIDYVTLKRWRDSDSDFASRLEQSRANFIQRNMRKAKPEFLLERTAPDYFREKKEIDLNHSGEVQFINDVPRPKDE